MTEALLNSGRGGAGIRLAILHTRLQKPASFPVWLTGMLCLAAAAILFQSGLTTYLAPFTGRGPALHLPSAPVTVRALGLLVFSVHCFSVVALGISGALILHRAWHPQVAWKVTESDPPWLHSMARAYGWMVRRPLALAWFATSLAIVICILGRAYVHYGAALGVSFAALPNEEFTHYVYPLVLYIWPVALLVLTNSYTVQRHFLPEQRRAHRLVRPDDVADLMHPADAPQGPTAATNEEDDWSFRRQVSWAWASVLRFIQLRTAVLRLRSAEIGHTDVQSRWCSQQALRGYRWGWDHRLSESNGWSLAVHALVIFGPLAIASMVGLLSCLDAWQTPIVNGHDAGPPPKKSIRVVIKPVRYLYSELAGIIFKLPPVIDEALLQELDQDTLHDWKGVKGAPFGDRSGHGDGESNGIGMDGVPGGAIRFIRLRHNGADWDRNMGPIHDCQMLREFGIRAGVKVARVTEAITIDQLQHGFKPGALPPFVYITGRKPFRISARDSRILKDYVLRQGGFIIGDSPGEAFASSFRTMMYSVLGREARWVNIPRDDELFLRPFPLPSGAPPLWHHDGAQAQGIKIGGRWVAFFHPGDMGDAWKIGHSGAPREAVEAAYDLGCNLIHYAVRQYHACNRGRL